MGPHAGGLIAGVEIAAADRQAINQTIRVALERVSTMSDRCDHTCSHV
jgi:hypothetical protein